MSDIVIPCHTEVQQTYQLIHLIVLKRALSGLMELNGPVPATRPLLSEAATERLHRYLLPILRNYPAIGRLLLNRPPGNTELQQLHQQIQQKLKGGELREYYFESHLVIYLIKSATIYLLASHPLDERSAALWEQKGLLD